MSKLKNKLTSLIKTKKEKIIKIDNIKLKLLKFIVHENGGIEKYLSKSKKSKSLKIIPSYIERNKNTFLTKDKFIIKFRLWWIGCFSVCFLLLSFFKISVPLFISIPMSFSFEIFLFLIEVYVVKVRDKRILKELDIAFKENNFEKILNNSNLTYFCSNKTKLPKVKLDEIIKDLLKLYTEKDIKKTVSEYKEKSIFEEDEKEDNLSNLWFMKKILDNLKDKEMKSLREMEEELKEVNENNQEIKDSIVMLNTQDINKITNFNKKVDDILLSQKNS